MVIFLIVLIILGLAVIINCNTDFTFHWFGWYWGDDCWGGIKSIVFPIAFMVILISVIALLVILDPGHSLHPHQ